MDESGDFWRDVAELWMGVALGEVPRSEGIQALLDASARHLGVACAVLDRRGQARMTSSAAPDPLAANGPRTSHALSDAAGQPLGTLVFYGEPPLLAGDRLARAMGALLHDSEEAASGLHKMRNKLMALLVNVELTEHVFSGSDPDSPLLAEVDRAERARALEAIALSANTVRGLIRMLEGRSDDRR